VTSKAEKYRQDSKFATTKAAEATGPYRELLLCIAEAYELLARLEEELFPSHASSKIEGSTTDRRLLNIFDF
jgi:hypothetical protein